MVNEKKCNVLTILFGFYLTFLLSTTILAYQLGRIGNYSISIGIFIFPLTYCISDIVTEIFDEKVSLSVILKGMLFQFIFSSILYVSTFFHPPPDWSLKQSYQDVLQPCLRFCFANSAGIAIGMYSNSVIFASLKKLKKGNFYWISGFNFFWLRSVSSSTIGEAITSIIADLIAFLGVYQVHRVVEIMVLIYIVKVIYAIFLSFPSQLIAAMLKNYLNIPLDSSNSQFSSLISGGPYEDKLRARS